MDKLYRYYITGIVTFTDKDKQEGTMMVNLFLNSDNADKITKPVFQAMHQACAKQYEERKPEGASDPIGIALIGISYLGYMSDEEWECKEPEPEKK